MTTKARKKRADVLLAERGLAEKPRSGRRRLIMEGLVFAPAGRVLKAGSSLAEDTPLEVRGRLPYVSRGGLKLAGALDTFGLAVEGKVALDVGASTGGFTDCLLQRGARHVVAVDVGRGQLHHRLRQDSRVTVMEKVNARYPYEVPDEAPGPVDLVVVDVFLHLPDPGLAAGGGPPAGRRARAGPGQAPVRGRPWPGRARRDSEGPQGPCRRPGPAGYLGRRASTSNPGYVSVVHTGGQGQPGVFPVAAETRPIGAGGRELRNL